LTDESLYRYAAAKLEQLQARDLLRELHETTRSDAERVTRDQRRLVSFACNDYLGLSRHPEVIEASCAATRQYGAGAGASRLVTGNHPLYAALERALASLKGTEDAVVFGSGYLTNIGVIPALVGADDLIVMDEHCHSCLFAGAALARSKVMRFAHNDAAAAECLLAEHRPRYRNCLVLTEGVFSMDGDRAPLAALLSSSQRYDAWLMSDDAHGLGVLNDGRGSGIVGGQPLGIPLQMGTLSKAVGVYGGYVCTSRVVADLIRNRARSLTYTTGLPPGVIASAIKAVEIIASDRELVARPLERARLFAARRSMPEPESPIVPVMLGTPARALAASRLLADRGYLAVAIRPPTVPQGTARLRCAFSAVHTPGDVEDFADALTDVLAGL